MNIILLSGGSGKRLWPLSNDVRSKQFIKLFQTENGSYESMLQRVYRQIREADPKAGITIATSKAQVSAIHNQLGGQTDLCVEPCRRDTFPAIALAAAWLHDRRHIEREEAVVVCPVDSFADQSYFEAVIRLGEMAREGMAKLLLLGIAPSYPSEKYGYILPADEEEVSHVTGFWEKPAAKQAADYIRQGGLWNGGVFASQLGYLLDRAHEEIEFTDYDDLFSQYETLESISFDHAVAEKERDLFVLRFGGEWKDLGTWNTLTEAMEEPSVGNAVLDSSCNNVHVINELDVPVLCMGLSDVVVSASPEGILVSDKESSSYIMPYVERMDQKIMFADKSWGSFRVMDVEAESMTIKVTLNPGRSMNYHSHERRDEVWTVIAGRGRTIVDGMEQPVSAGDVITMQAGCRHTVIADTELKMIEVQLGREISVHDKKKYELEE